MKLARTLLLLGLLVSIATSSPRADLVTVRVGLCSLEAPAGEERALAALADRAATILPELEADLGLRIAARFRMILIPAGAIRDSETARLDASAPPWAAGYYIPSARIGAIRIAAASRYPYGTLESVFGHEATHAILHDGLDDRLPQWFEEGVATWEGRRWSLQDAFIYTRSLLTSDLPRMAALDREFHAVDGNPDLAYAASFAFVSWNVRRGKADFVRRLLAAARTSPFPEAWRHVTGESLDDSERTWRRESLIRYRWIPVLTASSTLWIGITFLAVAAGVRRRARAKAIRDRWDQEERVEREQEAAWERALPAEEPETPFGESRSLTSDWSIHSKVDLSEEQPPEPRDEP